MTIKKYNCHNMGMADKALWGLPKRQHACQVTAYSKITSSYLGAGLVQALMAPALSIA